MFVVHGPVKHDSPVFIERHDAMATVSEWLTRAGVVGAILGARQTGKTSFAYWLSAHLRERYAFAFIDFQGFAGTTWDECASYIADRLVDLCADGEAPDMPRKGAELPRFLKRLAARVVAVRVVVIFEELGDLPERCRQRLANTIRSVFTERLQEPAYERYAFLIIGAYEVRDMAGTRNSPLWNVAEKLYLQDFELDEVSKLIQAATSARGECAQRLAEFVHEWTAGHPYWTQRLAQEVTERHLPGDPDFTDRAGAEEIARALIHTEDTNLPHFFELLERERGLLQPILDRVSAGEHQFSRSDKSVAILELLGAIANRDGRCVIRHRIYEMAIAQRWALVGIDRPAPTERATLVFIDMVGYSKVAKYLEYVVGTSAVGLLGESIKEQVRAGLERCGCDDTAVYGFTGDGAILRFAEAGQAHQFAREFTEVIRAHNRGIPDRTLWREYRMGAATGDIVPVGDQTDRDRAGLVFTRAQRLESMAVPGQFLIDISTWQALPEELSSLYGDEEQVEVKHDVLVDARRWLIA